MKTKIAPRPRTASLAMTVASAIALASLPLTAGHLSGYAAPTGLSAQAQDAGGDGNTDDVALTWSAYASFPAGCTQARELRIFRSDNGGAFAQIFATAGNATGYSDTALNEGTYDYVIQARCNVPGTGGPGGTRPDVNNLSLVSAAATASISNAPPCAGPSTVEATATPTTLWPPNGKLVAVSVTGNVTPQQNCTMPEGIDYVVVDEYEELTGGTGSVALVNGAFAFQVQLEASRLGTDLDGRLYGIDIEAADGGSYGFDVVVPHDQRKK